MAKNNKRKNKRASKAKGKQKKSTPPMRAKKKRGTIVTRNEKAMRTLIAQATSKLRRHDLRSTRPIPVTRKMLQRLELRNGVHLRARLQRNIPTIPEVDIPGDEGVPGDFVGGKRIERVDPKGVHYLFGGGEVPIEATVRRVDLRASVRATPTPTQEKL